MAEITKNPEKGPQQRGRKTAQKQGSFPNETNVLIEAVEAPSGVAEVTNSNGLDGEERAGEGRDEHIADPNNLNNLAPEAKNVGSVGEVTKRPARLRKRPGEKADQQLALFVADLIEAAPKDDQFSMEHPLFSLSKRRDTTIWRYQHRDVSIEIIPSALGRATIYDNDILIYCASQLVEALNRGREPSRKVRLTAHDFLLFAKRGTGGRSYELMLEALKRLKGTQVVLQSGDAGKRHARGRGLIEDWDIVEKDATGRLSAVDITLTEWYYVALMDRAVLTLNWDYFLLTSPLDRRLYALARKHCGQQRQWRINLELLHKKTGSVSTVKEFRRQLRERASILDYLVSLEDGDTVVFSTEGGPTNNS